MVFIVEFDLGDKYSLIIVWFSGILVFGKFRCFVDLIVVSVFWLVLGEVKFIFL